MTLPIGTQTRPIIQSTRRQLKSYNSALTDEAMHLIHHSEYDCLSNIHIFTLQDPFNRLNCSELYRSDHYFLRFHARPPTNYANIGGSSERPNYQVNIFLPPHSYAGAFSF